MQILSVALTNFKTHKDKQFDFQPGTNAICGENGAGKTSILEAIAWVLFNYQGSYKKEDLIRNGASSAQARIAFISSRDDRTYEVQRSTSGGYILFDPQLNERLPYTRTKDEVLPWLRQHLGVAPGTDLSQLFSNTIGVPQGTFTIDFLLPTEKRKPIFDTILKVEEYRETYKQSNHLRKYSEAQSQRLKDLIDQYEDSLANWNTLQTSSSQLTEELKLGNQLLTEFEKKATDLSQKRQRIVEQAEKIQAAQRKQQTLTENIKLQQQAQQRMSATVSATEKAADICKHNKPAYEQFLVIESAIKGLDAQSNERQQLLLSQQQVQKALNKTQGEAAKLAAQIEQLEASEQTLKDLEEDVAQQHRLEKEKDVLQKKVQTFANFHFESKNLDEQGKTIAKEIETVETEIVRLSALQTTIEQIPAWEEQKSRIQQQLSRIEAAQQFETEIRALTETGKTRQDCYRQQVKAALVQLAQWESEYAQIGAEEIESIKEALFQGGILSKETLTNLKDILLDLTAQTNRQQLQQHQKAIQIQLQTAYAQKAEAMAISTQEAKRKQLKTQQQKIQADLAALAKKIEAETDITKALRNIDNALKALDNPRAKQQLLIKALQQQASVKATYEAVIASQANSVQKHETIATNLKQFDQLDSQMRLQQEAKQTHQAGYLQYLQNQQAASQLKSVQAEAQTLAETLKQLSAEKTKVDQNIADLNENFDPEAFVALEKQLSEITSQADQLRGSLPQQQQRLDELTARINALKETAEKRDQARRDLKERDRIRRFVSYARKVYKAAGPRITERYVHNISKEADRLFRELLGRQNVALTWSADYEITVQEGAHTRRFINLSGGEQMCAALAVRLALLKILADIDVAFFDEPTTNMDRPRRASLAEAIARIRSFNQIFVISHDDTFEQVTETVVQVTREP
ncbi:MAG: SMC family ATPase [Cyanobacteria bacterium J06649_5]